MRLLLSAVLFMALGETCLAGIPDGGPHVIVVGATPGGIAAAVSAARCGRTVALVEWEDHIGGIVSNGLTNSDIGNKQAVAGLFYEFTRRVLRHYQALDGTTGTDGPNVKLCRDGYWFEPSVAERIYHNLIDGEAGAITPLLKQEVVKALLDGNRLVGIQIRSRDGGDVRTLRAPVLIDATYEGDLAALAGARFRTGRESRAEFGEPHAGLVYVKFGTSELLPGSTGEADQAIEGFCFRMHVTKNAANRIPIEKPSAFNRNDYQAVLADITEGRVKKLTQIIQFYPMPNDRYELNSDHPHPDTGVPSESFDLAEENWGWPTANHVERRKLYERYLSHNIGLFWLLQHDEAVPEHIRQEALQYGWCRDEWPDNGHVPRQVYVRQGRRIHGTYTLTQKDGDVDPELQRTRIRRDSIAIAEFAFDSHGCHRFDPAHPGVREGYIYIDHPPLQLPYGILVPEQIDGLLVPVACSSSHVGYQAIRMEPLFMALGQACGVAAHESLRNGIPLRQADVGAMQHLLVSRGAVIAHLDDVPFNHPAFAALQWLGARGFNRGYKAEPDKLLTKRDAAERLQRVLRTEGVNWPLPADADEQPLVRADVAQWLASAHLPADPRPVFLESGKGLKVSQYATMVYAAFGAELSSKH